jgi:UDP-3-O-[3-hydroxymyristoyl] glucosamine N-acyltransferase
MHVQELARRLGAEVDPAADLEVTGAGTLEEAGPGQLAFLSNPRYARQMEATRASAVLVEPGYQGGTAAVLLRVGNPYLAFARALEFFHVPPQVAPGVHATAVLGQDVVLGEGVAIGAYVVLGDRVRVGAGAVVHPHVVVYEDAEIGPRCLLHSHSVVREGVRLGEGVILQNGVVVGSDGFGFAPRGDGTYHKIPQAGTVDIADDVEIQANSCVDRAAVGTTRIGRGTKLDNLVQVGHGCQVGAHTLICGQVGLAGSSRVGNRVTLAGQVGVAGHLSIADDVVLAAQSGVANDMVEAGVYGGSPPQEMKNYREFLVLQVRLPELFRRVKALERRMEAALGAPPAGRTGA